MSTTSKVYKTLYKASKTGKTVQLSYEIEGAKYRAIHGYVNGALVTDAWTTAKPKNVGRSNEVNAEQQAINEVDSKITLKQKEGYTEDPNKVEDAKREINPMLAKVWDKYKDKIEFPVYSQPKLDGIRMETEGKGFFSREGNPFVTVDHLQKEVDIFMSFVPKGAKIDGELYNEVLNDDFNKIVSLIKRGKATKEELAESEKLVQYHIYDIDVPHLTFNERSALIHAIFEPGDFKYLRKVDTILVYKQDKLDELSENYLLRGYEGQMIRIPKSLYENSRSKNLLKRKPFMDDEFTIVGINEGDGNRSGMVGALVVQVSPGITSKTGIKGGVSFYKRLWKDRKSLVGKKATVRFQNYTPDGSLRIPVTIAIRDYE